MRAPAQRVLDVGGVELCFFEWGSPGAGGATVLLAHATGFHARCWDVVVRRLGDRHAIAPDQRGHGRSAKPPITHWNVFGRDLAALADHLGLEGAIGVGHSMGGHALVEAAAAAPHRYERLLLIDPVIASPGSYDQGGWVPPAPGEVHPVAKRKNEFTSAREMFERFEDRHPYSLFDREALRDYCEYGLLPAPGGQGFVLACPPEVEASIYMTSRTNPRVYDSVRSLPLPVVILRAPPAESREVMDFAASPTWPGLVCEFRSAREVLLPDLSHFVPMQAPALVARHVLGEGAP